jgi:BirA family biotin operon repressor/biotin-[acetyl-CoA-carboxylase] ligase
MATSRRARAPRTDRHRKLLALLADGESHSGGKLAIRLRVSRGAVWKLVKTLRGLGVEIESLSRRGYRLQNPVDLYDQTAIVAALSSPARRKLERVEAFLSIESTNRHLMESTAESPSTAARACVAEIQTAGRGRRGRSWTAPFGSGICLSISWQFTEAPPSLSALSLAIGVAVARAMQRLGCDVGLKWPNDVVWKSRKLAGILIEMRGESAGPAQVVIGIGLNMRMPSEVRIALAKQQAALVADLHEILRDRMPNRNVVVATLIDEVLAALETFSTQGFVAFDQEWQRLDSLAHAPVKVMSGSESIVGIANGVDMEGALLVDVNGDVRRFMSGDVSLRPLP